MLGDLKLIDEERGMNDIGTHRRSRPDYLFSRVFLEIYNGPPIPSLV